MSGVLVVSVHVSPGQRHLRCPALNFLTLSKRFHPTDVRPTLSGKEASLPGPGGLLIGVFVENMWCVF